MQRLAPCQIALGGFVVGAGLAAALVVLAEMYGH